MNKLSGGRYTILIAFALMFSPANAIAQGSPAGDLLGAAGQTSLQQATGGAVGDVCFNFIQTAPTTPLQSELFARCGEMVHTARVNANGSGPIGRNLDLTADELAGALQQLSGEESANQGTLATRTSHGQLSNLGARFSAIRAGASGVSLSGLTLFLDDEAVSLAGLEGAQGGGAQADDDLSIPSAWGFFINGGIGSGDKDATAEEDAFDFDSLNMTTGIDYRFDSGAVFGVAFGISDFQADFDSVANLTVSGGSTDSYSLSTSVFGLWGGNTGFYAEGLISYSDTDYDMVRIVEYPVGPNAGALAVGPGTRQAIGDTSSDQLSGGIGVGYQASTQTTYFGPFLRYRYLDIDIDGYTEAGSIAELALTFQDQTIESSQSILGFSIAKSISTGFGVLGLSARVDWRHEFNDDSRVVITRYVHDPNGLALPFVTEAPDENFYTAGLGITGAFKNGFQGFFQVDSAFGLEDISSYGLRFGLRKEFN